MSGVTVDTSVWEAVRFNVDALGAAHVRLGVIGGPHGDDEISMVEIAIIHELGSPAAGIPERSFIRATLAEKRNEIVAFQAKLVKAVLIGRIGASQAHMMLGEKLVSLVRAKITEGEGVPPPLKQATIDRKGSDRPLVDTGLLIRAIAAETVPG